MVWLPGGQINHSHCRCHHKTVDESSLPPSPSLPRPAFLAAQSATPGGRRLSLLPRGPSAFAATGWLIGTRRWDIAIHACIPLPPGVCRLRGTFQRCFFFIIISQLLNVQEIRNGSGNHSWKPSLQHEYSVAARVVAMTTVVMPNIQMPTTTMVIHCDRVPIVFNIHSVICYFLFIAF